MIGIGVVGCGYWGPNLIRNFLEVPAARVVACCDLRPAQLSRIAQRFPFLETTTDYREILDNLLIDAVCIATPVSTHFGLAKEAMLKGKHVLVEKPLAASVAEAEELVEISRKTGKTLMVGHTFLYTGAVNRIKEFVSSGEMGDTHYFESTRVNLGLFQNDINVVWDLGPHDISIMYYVLDLEPRSVCAFGQSHIGEEKENTAYIVLRFPGKTIGFIHLSWLSPVKVRRLAIGGSKKMVVYDDIETVEKVRIYENGVAVLPDPVGLLERQLVYRTGDIYVPKLDTTEPLSVECAHFVDCILSGKQPRTDGPSGLRVVRLLEAIQRSMDGGGGEVSV